MTEFGEVSSDGGGIVDISGLSYEITTPGLYFFALVHDSVSDPVTFSGVTGNNIPDVFGYDLSSGVSTQLTMAGCTVSHNELPWDAASGVSLYAYSENQPLIFYRFSG